MQGLFYFILVEYSSVRSANIHTSKRLTLQMIEDGVPRIIPPESLFVSEHLSGSPMAVTVQPSSPLCASVSSQALSSGTIITAGHISVFSLLARDAFGNKLSVDFLSNFKVNISCAERMVRHDTLTYRSVAGNISVFFSLTQKGVYNLQWLNKGIVINGIFPIQVAAVPNLPDFSSLSFIGNFSCFATAGVLFQHAMVVFDSFGNIRSFSEKYRDFTQNIQVSLNTSTEYLNHSVKLCSSDLEYDLFVFLSLNRLI
jgi:hypothetical protein